ncbi:MAG: hypothetical protein RMK89_14520, partial [Armatimonadota bacterium]|nr:hypothetical protein [Armatimonadota bacterium]MDW8144659.1 hypothetical protein [Armatimonadota bacterium]
IELLVIVKESQKFQSHCGAIATNDEVQLRYADACFNPTVVRLRLNFVHSAWEVKEMGKVSVGLIKDLRNEVEFQIKRLEREIKHRGATGGRVESLYRMKILRKLLCMLLNDGEIVIAVATNSGDKSSTDNKEGVMVKLSKFFRMWSDEQEDD